MHALYPLSPLTRAIGHDATTLFGTYYTHRVADDGIYFPISEDYANGPLTPPYSGHLWASSERPPRFYYSSRGWRHSSRCTIVVHKNKPVSPIHQMDFDQSQSQLIIYA
jgi:hypothetical protein